MTARLWHIVFVCATAAWAGALVLAPVVVGSAHVSRLDAALLTAVYAAGGAICHQLPARSFHLLGAQLPVCARCTGIYAGAALMASIGGARARTAAGGRESSRLILALAVLPSAATLVFEWTTGVAPGNWTRFAAGLPIGAAVAWLVRSAAENQVN
jgi:uncharacterized membrane protein